MGQMFPDFLHQFQVSLLGQTVSSSATGPYWTTPHGIGFVAWNYVPVKVWLSVS